LPVPELRYFLLSKKTDLGAVKRRAQ